MTAPDRDWINILRIVIRGNKGDEYKNQPRWGELFQNGGITVIYVCIQRPPHLLFFTHQLNRTIELQEFQKNTYLYLHKQNFINWLRDNVIELPNFRPPFTLEEKEKAVGGTKIIKLN